jgi:SAM-dependent methyltransferase
MQHPAMPLTREVLDRITASTLAHYDQRAEDYWQDTRDHDVSQNIATLLRHVEGAAPLSILDLGCGPGRDLKTFSDLGHKAIGLEGASRVAAMARSYPPRRPPLPHWGQRAPPWITRTHRANSYGVSILGRQLPTADVGYPAAQLGGQLSGGEIAHPAVAG